MSADRILVVGSNSFSGSHFVDFMLRKGAEVAGISRSPELDPVFLPYRWQPAPSFKFYQYDLNHHLDEIMKVVEQFKPAYVVNFAAQGMVAESWKHPEHWFQTNVVANVRFHDQLRSCGSLKKYVQVSTPEVYGHCEGLVRESTVYNPSTPYAVSKAAIDMNLMCFHKAYGFPVVFTRAANVYGPGQQLYRIIPRAIISFLTGRQLPLHGGGRSVRSFVHIRDVADCTWRIAQFAEPGQIYHISTERLVSIRELVEKLAAKTGVSFNDHVQITEDRLGKDAAYRLDSTKARQALKWKDRMSLDEGLDEVIQWVRDHRDVLARQSWDYIHKA